ncbi:acyltransferase [Burkholderia multivorans]|uniref:acyltransferase family protein n=1 Tax=Burkholderia multivorans TaxID=87883 RepID=UPI00190655F4|nr:acyltransferase [Burkholderia multivorans]MBJ9658373.1 acyltransferase [Burkholderia multivorans]
MKKPPGGGSEMLCESYNARFREGIYMQLAGISLAIPSILIVTTSLIFAWIISTRSTFYRKLIDDEVTKNRFHSIDGLRGYLAMSVALSHLVVNHQFYTTGKWQGTPSSLATFFGSGGVAFFFMITAFLFWNRISFGNAAFDAVKFLQSRVHRLVPMYLVASILVILTALLLTHLQLNVSPLDLAKQIASWILFTAPGDPDINGFNGTSIINGVFWTLVYEWKFYLLLPLLAALINTRARNLIMPAACACIYLFAYPPVEWLFVSGAIASVAIRNKLIKSIVSRWWFAIIATGIIAATIRLIPQPYSLAGATMLFLPFLSIASGNTIFGLLTLRPARLLGAISYSFYLMHSWVLYILYRVAAHFADVSALSEIEYWAIGLLVFLASIALSSFTFRFVEAPFMRTANKIALKSERDHALTGAGR